MAPFALAEYVYIVRLRLQLGRLVRLWSFPYLLLSHSQPSTVFNHLNGLCWLTWKNVTADWWSIFSPEHQHIPWWTSYLNLIDHRQPACLRLLTIKIIQSSSSKPPMDTLVDQRRPPHDGRSCGLISTVPTHLVLSMSSKLLGTHKPWGPTGAGWELRRNQ